MKQDTIRLLRAIVNSDYVETNLIERLMNRTNKMTIVIEMKNLLLGLASEAIFSSDAKIIRQLLD